MPKMGIASVGVSVSIRAERGEMALAREEVERVARLARLELTEKEVLTFCQQLGKILDYVETLKEVSVEGVEATSHPTGKLLPLRRDRPEDPLPVSSALSNAPKKKDGQFKVPPAVTKEKSKGENAGD